MLEFVGVGSVIFLLVGDWVIVVRYEEGRRGLDFVKNE